jgi:16S rRNA (guanine1207-N2)-methyltransferase
MPFSQRLTLARVAGLTLPDGPVPVFGVTPDTDLSTLRDACDPLVVSRDARVHDRFPGAVETPPQSAPAAIVLLSRERARARAELAEAAALSTGPVVVDGQKADGIAPMLKALGARTEVSAPISKAHGKLFWCETAPDLSDWRAAPHEVDGLRSWPGVFSADRVDAGSALLARALPARIGAAACDLGAGWGWLSAQIAGRADDVHMVETDGWALDCARHNVPGAVAHWADVTTWQHPRLFDAVVMNPPFHEGRKGAPDLGRAFIAKAAEILAPSGHLFMVANRHLPYEAELAARFGTVEEVGGDGRYKLFHARKPQRRPGDAARGSRRVARARR